MDGDAQSTIGYLVPKQDRDLLFFHIYDIDNEGRMRRLFWADSQSRIDYENFGGVLVFDPTY